MELKSSNIPELYMRHYLLIVPYGIEITIPEAYTADSRLLIVPYGIEILQHLIRHKAILPFNCTLWN